MNLQKFTQKSLEAIQNAQSNAVEYGNPQLDQQHLLLALLQQEDGLIPGLLQKMNINVNGLTQAVENEVKRLPRVSGGETRVAVDLEKALTAAEKLAENMTDEYVSVEHIFMAMVNAPNAALKELFRQYNVDRDGFMKILATVRGNTRVTSDSPEATYDALKKYGTDLVEKARSKKLDPVIGRDDEIRNVIRILSRKTKNNPVLIGEPGVGKTAIAEVLDRFDAADRHCQADAAKDRGHAGVIVESSQIRCRHEHSPIQHKADHNAEKERRRVIQLVHFLLLHQRGANAAVQQDIHDIVEHRHQCHLAVIIGCKDARQKDGHHR